MRLRKERARAARRAFAGRRLGVALATAGLLGLSLTSGVIAASPANAASADFTVINAQQEMCMTSGGASDTVATEYSCNYSPNQYWYWDDEDGGTGYYQLRNEATNQCLGVLGGSTAKGAEVVVWQCLGTGHPDQYWQEQQLYPFNGVTFTLFNANSGQVLQVKCDCRKDSAPLDQEPLDDLGSPNQQWII
jgi:hypothetical protein